MLDEGCSQQHPVPAWIEQKEAIVLDGDNETPNKYTSDSDMHVKQELDLSPQATAVSITIIEPNIRNSAQNDSKEENRAAKKAKKEARKRERAEKREAKKLKKEAKESKKLKKEAKKRKRD